MYTYKASQTGFGPVLYTDFMKAINQHCSPSSYFEIGTQAGISASAFTCATVCVDPEFRIEVDITGRKPSIFMAQTTSDEFFEKYDLKSFFKNGPDLCFLDGMHRFEYLLRDFINTERACHRRSTIMAHDCYPLNNRMALRQHVIGDESESPATRYGWTGDVWKLIPILKKYRPDLSILVADAPPSGLVLISNLDPSSRVLSDNYNTIVEEFRAITLDEYGPENLWQVYPFLSVQKLLERPDEMTTFFAFR